MKPSTTLLQRRYKLSGYTYYMIITYIYQPIITNYWGNNG